MPKVVGYHRPTSVDEAVGLLSQPGTVILAGGTVLNARREGSPVVAIDVQALGLDGIVALAPGHVRIGAAGTLQALADSEVVPALLADLARRELPSTLRTLATVGGTVAAGSSTSQVLAGLLVHDAVVGLRRAGETAELSLAAVLADRSTLQGALVTHVTVATGGSCAAQRTGRTPGDEPIVAAVARRGPDGRVRLALCGVAETPVLVEDPAAVSPPGDFRGSSDYRRHVAAVLSDRVRAEVAA